MKFDSAGRLEDLIWNSRLADLPRSENRAILQRMYGGEPPFNEDQAEENSIEINRNDLTGVNMLSQARSQWDTAFLSPKSYFNVTLDSGPAHKRQDWGGIITKNINRRLRRNPKMREQIRATGAQVMLHGIGPVNWKDRRSPIPCPIPISSLMIPSETGIDFDNLEWFSVFREWTPTQLYCLTHGPKRDPGWNMPLVMSQMRYVADKVQKEPNATAYQYMPERIEELVKQDMGFWGSDAVPTIDVWDTYFREAEDGKGWYRRVILDWGVTGTDMKSFATTGGRPQSKNKLGEKTEFLYSSGKRCYAQRHSEIIHCQFGDTSAYAPFKYHSVRSLGWMLWGACDLQNRLYCKFMENAFMNLMWWFRVSGEASFNRIKRADFFHMGVIPNGVTMIPAAERFSPDAQIVQLAFDRNRQLMADNAAAFTSDFSKGESGKEMTATETMARVNAVNAMVGGMLTLAYSYEDSKNREIARRMCIKNNPDCDAREFRKDCLKEGVPENYLDSDLWNIEAEQVIGGGNKTVEMATVQFLNSIRQNMGPEGQRLIDHISVFSATKQPDLAEAIAPVAGQKRLSDSMHDAQLATERLMAGLPFVIGPKMIPEDYVKTWLADFALMIQKIEENGSMATMEQIMGFQNVATHIGQFLQMMSSNEADKQKVRLYQDALNQLMNMVKGYAQRLQQQMQQGAQAQGGDPAAAAEMEKTKAKIEGDKLLNAAKAANMRESHAMRTSQKQAQFELEEQRKERQAKADARREELMAAQQMTISAAQSLADTAIAAKEAKKMSESNGGGGAGVDD